jgi:hypothetical protein
MVCILLLLLFLHIHSAYTIAPLGVAHYVRSKVNNHSIAAHVLTRVPLELQTIMLGSLMYRSRASSRVIFPNGYAELKEELNAVEVYGSSQTDE